MARYSDRLGPDRNQIVPRDAQNRLLAPTSLVNDAHRAGLRVHPYTFRPPAIQSLLHGRGRVEVSYEETVESLAWAERIDGWSESGGPPLRVHPHDPRVNGR